MKTVIKIKKIRLKAGIPSPEEPEEAELDEVNLREIYLIFKYAACQT